jgi:hypothetical protein
MITLFAALTSFANAKDFYENKELKFIIAASPSIGGFDMTARTIGKYLPKYIPGNPSIVYKNMAGSGGIAATNLIFEEANQDGTTILFPIYNTLISGITRDSNEIKYSSGALNWIIATDDFSEDRTIVYKRKDVQPNADYSNILYGETAASKTFEIGPLLKNVLGLNVKLIYGYKSKAELDLALERNEINSYNVTYSLIRLSNYDNINRIAEPLFQYGRIERSPIFPNVVSVYELAKTEKQQEILKFAQFTQTVARPVAVGPLVSKEKVEILRKAFMDACKNTDYIKEMHGKFHYTNCVEGSRVHEIVSENEARYQRIKHLLRSE